YRAAQYLAGYNATTVLLAGRSLARAVARDIETHNLCAIHQLELTEAGLNGLAISGSDVSDAHVETARSLATMDTTATVVYTSGTTGTPKGAMISHGNLAEGAVNIVPFAGDIVLSDSNPRLLMFLPLAHILARAVQYFCLVAG